MRSCEDSIYHTQTDVLTGNVDVISREAAVRNVERINEYFASPDKQNEFLTRQETILSRPRHYLFDQSEEELAKLEIAEIESQDEWLVRRVNLNDDMFAPQALGAIVEGPPLNIDLSDREKRRSFSTTLISHGIKSQKDILVVLNNLHQLDPLERPEFLDRLMSADMKAEGGIRQLPGARKLQYIATGDVSKLSDVFRLELFHSSQSILPEFDEETARNTLQSLQAAFKTLRSEDSVEIFSARNTGKSTAFVALRHEFPSEVYIYRLDKRIVVPSDVYKQEWHRREGQIVIFDKAEFLEGDERAIQFLESIFHDNKRLFSRSS